MKTFREYLLSLVDCDILTNVAWNQCLIEAEFERERINAEMDGLYIEEHGRSSAQEDTLCKPR